MIVVLVTYEKAVDICKQTRTERQYVWNDDGVYRILIDTGGAVPIYTEWEDDGSGTNQPSADFPKAIEADGIQFTEEIDFNVK